MIALCVLFSPLLYSSFPQMKVAVAITILAVCIAACIAEETREKRQTKPGRFLSLPIPAKCASRKYFSLSADNM